jgi:hypothetical protein
MSQQRNCPTFLHLNLESWAPVFTSVISAALEAEIGRIEVRGQPEQIVIKTPSPESPGQNGEWRSGSTGHRASVLQVRSPEFKSQCYKTKKDQF